MLSSKEYSFGAIDSGGPIVINGDGKINAVGSTSKLNVRVDS